MLTLGPRGVDAASCKEKVLYLTVVVEILAAKVMVMGNSTLSCIVFVGLGGRASAPRLRADLST